MEKLTMDKKAIRILCTGDRHVKKDRSNLGPYYKGHARIVEIAKQYQVHAVADTGDSRVDCGSSRYADACEMENLILPLAQAGIGYWSIDGNHDRPGASHKEITANSWMQHLKDNDLWRNVEYWDQPTLIEAKLNDRILQVLPIPYPPRHVFATGKDLKTKKELDTAASEYIQSELKRLAEKIVRTDPLLILFHGTVDSPRLQTAGEARMPAGHDVNIPIDAFNPWPSTAVACGHIHKYQILSDDQPLVFYTGPLIPQEFDHEGMDTGVVIVEFGADGVVRHEFVPIETIGYKTVVVTSADVDGAHDSMGIARIVREQVPNPERTVVKVIIRAQSADVIDRAELREILEDKGIIEPRIVIEMPEAPAVIEMEQKIHEEIGINVNANVAAYLKEHPEIAEALAAVAATEQDVMHVVAEIESEVNADAI